jgi:hypothetical protein
MSAVRADAVGVHCSVEAAAHTSSSAETCCYLGILAHSHREADDGSVAVA